MKTLNRKPAPSRNTTATALRVAAPMTQADRRTALTEIAREIVSGFAFGTAMAYAENPKAVLNK